MESKLQVSATPLVPFVQTLAHRTPLIEHERENLIYIFINVIFIQFMLTVKCLMK